MIILYILIGISVIISYLIYRWLRKPKLLIEYLTSATNFKSIFIKHLENNMSEVYKLTWSPSTSSIAVLQDVNGEVNGETVSIIKDVAITSGEVQTAFPTNAVVQWWVVTYNADKSKSIESGHTVFVAVEELVAATELKHAWVGHVV